MIRLRRDHLCQRYLACRMAASWPKMPDHSMYRTRARRSGAADAPPLRRAGRPRNPETDPRKRRYLIKLKALALWVDCIAGLLQKGILPGSPDNITDIKRLGIVSRAAAQCGMPPASRCALLVLDWAARSPSLSKAMLGRLTQKRARPEAWSVLRTMTEVREAWAANDHRTFWSGPSKLCARRFLASVSEAQLAELAGRLGGQRSARVSKQLQECLEGLPYLGSYLGFSMLRAVAHSMKMRLRDSELAAASMSNHTKKVASCLPLAETMKRVHVKTGERYGLAYLGYIYCSTVKLLMHERVLSPIATYSDCCIELLNDLASDAMVEFVAKVASLPDEPTPEGDREIEALRQAIPTDGFEGEVSGNVLKRWLAKRRRAR